MQADECDYAAAFRAIDAGDPGPVGGCVGCFRCRAGDHGTCHGCSCPCSYRYMEPTYSGRCPEECRNA